VLEHRQQLLFCNDNDESTFFSVNCLSLSCWVVSCLIEVFYDFYLTVSL